MAELDHIFQASVEACPICIALDGTLVSAGYVAHDNCTCQTIPAGDEGVCKLYVGEGTVNRYGPGPFDVIVMVRITVFCPDGTDGSVVLEGDLRPGAEDVDQGFARLEDAIDDTANELCELCPEPKPFLCC
jgi:hypothetical protein